ncbi:MAG: SRPBCC family protein [Solirubrobacterales bacterium]
MRIEESIEIASSPDAVWAVVADPLNDPSWCPKVKSVMVAGEARWIVSHKPVPLRPPIELTLEHLEVAPPSRLSLRQEDEASIFDVEYRLEPSHGGTRLTQISEFEWKKLPRVLHGTFARGVRRDVRGQLQALKRLLEG